jgi:hypothetical protein
VFLLCTFRINSHMARSSTMPLKGEHGGSSGELRVPSNGYLGSISSLAGSGLKTLAGGQLFIFSSSILCSIENLFCRTPYFICLCFICCLQISKVYMFTSA